MTANTAAGHAGTGHAIHDRIDNIHMQMLDAIERVLAALAPAAPPAAPQPSVVRRQVANTLGLWRFCARSTCHRSRCCRGEPTECLRTALPLLPAETVESLLTTRKDRRRHRRPALRDGRFARSPERTN